MVDNSEITKEKLIARIQCFYDQLIEYRNGLFHEEESERDIIYSMLDAYQDLFEDICVCKNDGKVLSGQKN